ncbi:hypothetical protein ZWY2020_012781 [Hordeum vulgare]|nr:hypothetical protein ZWY2020_012781 [Hordeum vulgare]
MAAAPSVADGRDGTAVTGSVSDVPKLTGTHEFTIRDYSRTKGIGVGKSILSEHFSVNGRRWYIRFYPDGYSTADGAWIAFYAQTLHKPQLRPVRAEFSFQLLGPDGEVRHTRRSDRACKYDTFCNSWGIRRYITRYQLESAALGAIHADSITVRCTVTIHRAQRRSLAVNRPGLVKMPPPPPSNHGENAIRFLASRKAPFDVRFEVDGEVFEAHRMVVAAQSSWFEASSTGTAARREGRASPSRRRHRYRGGVQGVLHFIYTDELPGEAAGGRGSYDVTLRLFAAADYYLIDRLKLMCACRLGDFIKDSTVEALMEIAEAYSCNDLQQACRNFAARRGLRLGIVDNIKLQATNLYMKANDLKIFNVRKKHSICAAWLYIACRQANKPRTIKEICTVTNGVTKKEISRAKYLLVQHIEEKKSESMEINSVRPRDLVRRFCSTLGMSNKAIQAAEEAANRVQRLDIRRNAISIAGTIIYLISKSFMEPRDKVAIKDICFVAGLTEITIRSCHKELYNYAPWLLETYTTQHAKGK